MSQRPVTEDARDPERLSVVIPSNNGASAICAALRSASRNGVEVVVIDDGSTDGTAEAVRSCAPAAVVHSQSQRGRSAARNAGASRARGQYLIFLDDDDALAADALDCVISHLASDRQPALIRLGVEFHRQSGVEVVFPRATRPYDGPFIPGSFAISRRLFDRIGGYDERLSFAENSELLLRAVDAIETTSADIVCVPLIGVRHIHRSDVAEHYRPARMEAVDLLLTKHADFYKRHRRQRRDILAIAAHDHAALQEFRIARQLAWRSFLAFPGARAMARLGRIAFQSHFHPGSRELH